MFSYLCAHTHIYSNIFYKTNTCLLHPDTHIRSSTRFIYIYIYIERERERLRESHIQTFLLNHNFSLWLDLWDTSRWDRKLPKFTSDRQLSFHPLGHLISAWEFNAYVLSCICLHFTLSYTGVFQSVEELFITLVDYTETLIHVKQSHQSIYMTHAQVYI